LWRPRFNHTKCDENSCEGFALQEFEISENADPPVLRTERPELRVTENQDKEAGRPQRTCGERTVLFLISSSRELAVAGDLFPALLGQESTEALLQIASEWLEGLHA
jgi:hypothetical protein